MQQIITNNKEILKRYGRNHKPLQPEPENPTPKICPICNEKMFARIINRRIIYMGCLCSKARPYPRKFIK